MNNLKIIGIMSGTSLDGLDIALCKFNYFNERWNYELVQAVTYPYEKKWKERLSEAASIDAFHFIKLHKEYGKYVGEKINLFLKSNHEEANLIASHGHTIFHRPEEGLTFQIGDGAYIAAETGITTISDFRNLDVALGGQGAPLVPIGDGLLFGDYSFCLNLGGFANISFHHDDRRLAFDICPVNIILNPLAGVLGKEYDRNGEIGRQGTICQELLDNLNNLDYYKLPAPKSLGKEWIESCFEPLLDKFAISIPDKMRTIYEHVSTQLARAMNTELPAKVLVSGGGAFNTYLIELLQGKTKNEIVIPPKNVVEYKEALIFAFLGLLRWQNKNNCLASATGARHDNSGGCIYLQ
ncbi:MAG: anhydro-N-acetylmuramic acid kinase [Bacteroidota bacterium]|nr:anhydro-N-acetylmuramic acid kinase [Bacteroidota bacterium]